MNRLRLGLVLSTRPWVRALHSYVTDHLPEISATVIRDSRAALDAVDVVLLDDITPWLSPSFVDTAAQHGVTLVGVFDSTERGGRDRLRSLGISHVIDAAMPAAEMAFMVSRVRPIKSTSVDTAFASIVADLAAGDARDEVVVAGGPPGAGACDIAVGLADHWSGSMSVGLVDANELSPGVARRLGLPLAPNILTSTDDLTETATAGRLPFAVLAGIPVGRDWERFVRTDIDALLQKATSAWDRVVVTTSPLVEDLGRWVDRYAISRRLLQRDRIVAACEATPLGVMRFLDWMADAEVRSCVVVVNKAPKSPHLVAEVRDSLCDALGDRVAEIVVVPFDKSVAAADWNASLVTGRRFRAAIANVADAVERVSVVHELA